MAEENIVKRVCSELGITQRELAERIGMSADSLNNAVSNNKVSQQTQKFLNFMLEHEELKKELSKYENLKNALKDAVF
ncbi:helix-turn-helix transcriptional regulator [Campylobacter sp. faydin G-140]|uniref:helix-turn-helix domain-containing protein n=1 Tax=Campylobacter anatolicus TaxID=2829105 RepID=UPI001BA019AA|nr:helix-turn-helix transcriptional regulator [Campylobacter anatolicus]MBR8466215.1 helix-turn-helix transcriptional regulator [Campylobacter anatolicus]